MTRTPHRTGKKAGEKKPMSSENSDDHPMDQGASGTQSDHDKTPATTTLTVDGDITTTTMKGISNSPGPDVSKYQNPMSTTTHSPYDSTGAPAEGEVGGVAASMNERAILSNKKTRPSLPFVYPRHDAAGPDDSTANYVAEAEEATIPVVDAALHDPRAERLRAAEQRAAEAEADRPAAERRLADETRSLRERLANLSKRQWLGIGLSKFGLLVIVVSVTFAV
jgi:hypothetical protein